MRVCVSSLALSLTPHASLALCREMRRQLRAALGTDLTKPTHGNALWWTGNAVPLYGGDYRERQPWLYREWTAAGLSAGSGRTSRATWREFVEDFLAEHWWQQPREHQQ